MNSYDRGDVVLVRYRGVDEKDPRLRPALVVSSETYQQGRQQMVLAAITSSYTSLQPGDTAVQAWQSAGLVASSVVTGVLLTVTPDIVERRLGSLEAENLHAVENSLRLCLGL
jgi:mRNA-degrading endonuclease toxin of MazEF toxin-antitoxin module